MNNTINWGILGPGKIAHKFADAFRDVAGANLYAIASRDGGRGKEFASKFKVPKVYTDYESLVKDPKVDIIYVATPHPFHHAQTLLCLNHGKAVVCEKPLAMNHKQAGEMIALAKSKGVFLMEGMWSRFFPATVKVLDLVRSGDIGEIRFMRADFGFMAPFLTEERVYNLALGGGAQLDVGVYPMFLTLLLLGKPDGIQAMTKKAVTGADETTSVQFHFANGSLAQILSSVAADTGKQAEIVGSKGSIVMHAPWHKAQLVTVRQNSGESQTFEFPFSGFGFQYELAHATECMTEGLKESALMPHQLSHWMAETADEVLRQCGVVYV